MEHSPGEITQWATKQASVNLGNLKSYQASYLTTTSQCWKSKKKGKKQKHLKSKKYATKQRMDNCGNRKKNT